MSVSAVTASPPIKTPEASEPKAPDVKPDADAADARQPEAELPGLLLHLRRLDLHLPQTGIDRLGIRRYPHFHKQLKDVLARHYHGGVFRNA